MGLLVYRFSDYNHTAEREQFRSLCKSLKEYYGNKPHTCIFIGNFNIGNVELDGLIIKNDAIIAIEFKNYGGKIIAADNGEWMLSDGTIIKGGSKKTVYQQVSLNRNQAKKGLKATAHLTNKQVQNLNSLVVFNQPIEAIDSSRLTPDTKCWLHIADNTSFIEKVQDITSENIEFEHKEILALLKSLYLDRRYLLEEYSDLECLDENYSPKETAVDFHADSDIMVLDEVLEEEEEDAVEPKRFENHRSKSNPKQDIDEDTQSEIDSLSIFIEKLIKQICSKVDYTLNVYRYDDTNLRMTFPNLHPKRQWFLIIKIPNALSIVDKVRKLLQRDVQATNDHLTFEIGMPISEEEYEVDNRPLVESEATLNTDVLPAVEKLKAHTSLPSWLDRLIYETLGAQYNPDYQKHSFNLDLSEDEVQNYLGTYFPRSYAEAFCIYDDLCKNSKFIELIKEKEEIHILDLGCGTGGELVGLLTVLEKYIPTNVKFKVEAIDGNAFSLEKFKEIAAYVTKKSRREYTITTVQNVIGCTDDIEKIAEHYNTQHFDFIQMCKFGCELESRRICKMANPYQLLLTLFGKLLSTEGMFLVLDVTTLSKTDNQYYSQLLNMGVRDALRKQPKLGVLLPLCCAKYNDDCMLPCFTQKEFSVRHSRKNNDISKVAYRIVSHKQFINHLHLDVDGDYQYLINSNRNNELNDCLCKYSKSNGNGTILDAYKIKTK